MDDPWKPAITGAGVHIAGNGVFATMRNARLIRCSPIRQARYKAKRYGSAHC